MTYRARCAGRYLQRRLAGVRRAYLKAPSMFPRMIGQEMSGGGDWVHEMGLTLAKVRYHMNLLRWRR